MSGSNPVGDTSYCLRRVLLGLLSLILLVICIGLTYVIPLINPLQGVEQPLMSETYSLPTVGNSTAIRPDDSMIVTDVATITARSTATSENDRETAQVVRVIDGDTIEVALNGEMYTVRYIGIDSPEPGQRNSAPATKANRELVEGKIVLMERDVSETDQYGRLLRYVYLEDGILVNALLAEMGYAIAVAYPPDVKYQALITKKQEIAQNSGLGFWAASTATVTPLAGNLTSQIMIDPDCSQFNAPGNDNQNLNEEYVCLVNPGQEAVDMSGWSISDQYGWIYVIGEFSLDAGAEVKVRSGCGENTQVDLFWCRSETAVWNNDGDCVYLNNAAGEAAGEYCY